MYNNCHIANGTTTTVTSYSIENITTIPGNRIAIGPKIESEYYGKKIDKIERFQNKVLQAIKDTLSLQNHKTFNNQRRN